MLRGLAESSFSDCASSFLHPYEDDVKKEDEHSPYFDLPSVLVPPEVIELANLDDGEEDNVPVQKAEEWPEYRIRLFDNDVGKDDRFHTLKLVECFVRSRLTRLSFLVML